MLWALLFQGMSICCIIKRPAFLCIQHIHSLPVLFTEGTNNMICCSSNGQQVSDRIRTHSAAPQLWQAWEMKTAAWIYSAVHHVWLFQAGHGLTPNAEQSSERCVDALWVCASCCYIYITINKPCHNYVFCLNKLLLCCLLIVSKVVVKFRYCVGLWRIWSCTICAL